MSQPVQHTDVGRICIEKRADKSQHPYVGGGLRTLKDKGAEKVRGQKKAAGTEKTKQKAGDTYLPDQLPQSPVLACCLNLGHSGEHHHGDGIGDGRRKQNTGHGDPVQDSVMAQGCGAGEPVKHKAFWNGNDLDALKDIQRNPVSRDRYGMF